MIPSPKVATYDLQPEMSCPELTAKLVEDIRARRNDLIVCNIANPDMVGNRSEENTSELQSLMRTSYAVFCLKKKTIRIFTNNRRHDKQHTKLIFIMYIE